MVLRAPDVPVAIVRTEAGLTSPTAVGCGISWVGPGGEESYESCERYPVPDGTPVLAIDAGETLDVEVPGVAVNYWSVGCGQADELGGDYLSPDGCDLGAGASAPIRFMPWAGSYVLQIWIQGQLPDGTTFSAPYFIRVDAID